MTTYIKRVQSRLSRQGIKVSLQQIREVYVDMVDNAENPTEKELDAIAQHFISNNSKLAPPSNDSVGKTGVITSFEESSLTVNEDEEETHPEQTHTHTPSASTLATTNTQVKGMVNYKASEMGIQLAASEVDVIASKVDASASSFTDTLNQIESALIAYVEYQQTTEANQVDGMLSRVTQKVIQKNQATTQHLTTGINHFKTALEVAEQHQKRELTSILNRLKVPS